MSPITKVKPNPKPQPDLELRGFKHFPFLPFELRREIWRQAALAERSVHKLVLCDPNNLKGRPIEDREIMQFNDEKWKNDEFSETWRTRYAIKSWAPANKPTFYQPQGLAQSCREARLVVHVMNNCVIEGNYTTINKNIRRIPFYPEKDLLYINLYGPNAVKWTELTDVNNLRLYSPDIQHWGQLMDAFPLLKMAENFAFRVDVAGYEWHDTVEIWHERKGWRASYKGWQRFWQERHSLWMLSMVVEHLHDTTETSDGEAREEKKIWLIDQTLRRAESAAAAHDVVKDEGRQVFHDNEGNRYVEVLEEDAALWGVTVSEPMRCPRWPGAPRRKRTVFDVKTMLKAGHGSGVDVGAHGLILGRYELDQSDVPRIGVLACEKVL